MSDDRIDAYTLNGPTRTLSYDVASRITDISDTIIQTFGYDNPRYTGYLYYTHVQPGLRV